MAEGRAAACSTLAYRYSSSSEVFYHYHLPLPLTTTTYHYHYHLPLTTTNTTTNTTTTAPFTCRYSSSSEACVGAVAEGWPSQPMPSLICDTEGTLMAILTRAILTMP